MWTPFEICYSTFRLPEKSGFAVDMKIYPSSSNTIMFLFSQFLLISWSSYLDKSSFLSFSQRYLNTYWYEHLLTIVKPGYDKLPSSFLQHPWWDQATMIKTFLLSSNQLDVNMLLFSNNTFRTLPWNLCSSIQTTWISAKSKRIKVPKYLEVTTII